MNTYFTLVNVTVELVEPKSHRAVKAYTFFTLKQTTHVQTFKLQENISGLPWKWGNMVMRWSAYFE